MINSNIMKSHLTKRGIEIKTEKTFAGNDIRFFVWKGQKIYFDTETAMGGTTFAWNEEQLDNLLFIIDNVKEENQLIYYSMDESTMENFVWGKKEHLVQVEFLGCWKMVDGKVCREIG